MIKCIAVLSTIVITSFYFFPFVFSFFPFANTKMILAACGLVLLLVQLVSGGKSKIDKNFIVLSAMALAVSFASFLSMTINNTPDGSYLSYIVSMWVWLGGAYFVVNWIKRVHGTVSVELVCFYLIVVGVCQCVIALLIDQFEFIKAIVDDFLAGTGFMGKVEGRLYGIGCALDVAGGRFAVLLVMIACLLPKVLTRQNSRTYIFLLVVAYCIIAVIGNMIGRTTFIGLCLSIVYLMYYLICTKDNRKIVGKSVLSSWLVAIVLIVSVIFVTLYESDTYWREMLRFGFEGVFSLVESGKWEVHSNEMLKEGLIFPENIRTWLIGDGYMGDPYNDPYYVGPASYGFYMNTDAGYSRFLFYFGLTGLLTFSMFLYKCADVCIEKFNGYSTLFLLILFLNYVIWVKVTTDIFLVFALFLCISKEDNDEYEKSYENPLSDPLDI